MELVIALIGAFTGIAGLVLACVVAVRQSFYDEYIAKRGNGTVVKSWLLEGQRDK